MHDVAKMELVKLDIIIKKQRYSLFIKFETVNLILLGVAFPAFEFKRFNQCLAQNVFWFGSICKFIYNDELCIFVERGKFFLKVPAR